jgi:SAM-dependent MidA family methyltransferase
VQPLAGDRHGGGGHARDLSLTPVEQAHSDCLVARIREEIDGNGGWISFARFMEMALYEPGLGYYSAGATKLGAGGDFITAPELSPLFSRCLAGQCAEVLQALGGGDVLELGGGSGVMAADMLDELERLGALPQRYLVLEVSADLRQRQLATLAARGARHLARVQWLDALPPARAVRGVIVANEVMDALPVERFRIRGGAVNALGVTWQLGRLDWSETRAEPALARRVRQIEQQLGMSFPEGYASEVNLRLDPWVRGLGKVLGKGVVLLVDYGLPRRQYYRPERGEGTLLCHFRHRFHHDPFVNVGLQDLGAWVDFTTVAEAAVAGGLQVAGFATQAHFLMGLGIERHLRQPHGTEELAGRIALARQAMVLTLPGEMGERFKAIGLTKGYKNELSGFSIRDLAASL